MINLTEIFVLDDPFISAGSGIALVEDTFFVVSDDEVDLFALKKDFNSRGVVYNIIPERLPETYKERKKLKPDFEAIVSLGSELLLLPSGSKPNRHRGALFCLRTCSPKIVSFKNVYAFLEKELPELNLEGAAVLGENIRLFQRGNGKLRHNGFIDLNLESFLKDEVKDYRLKLINLNFSSGAPLTFNDATIFQDEIIFLAASEKADSTYEDGEFGGAVIGKMTLGGEVLKTFPLNISSKPEGICCDKENFFIVTDDDNRANPSRIYRGSLSSFQVN